MVIQIDSREKSRAIKKIIKTFDEKGVKHPVSKLIVIQQIKHCLFRHIKTGLL